mgnify:CR=1 FL=1
MAEKWIQKAIKKPGALRAELGVKGDKPIPAKKLAAAAKKPGKGKVGRPKGDNGRLQEFKDRLLATGGTRILDKMISIALDDGHPGQMAAIKLAVDRILPMSAFDAAKNAGSTPQVTINISGINEPTIIGTSDEDVIDI